MTAKPKILFLSHSASRNGATILLLHLLRWLKEEGSQQFEVLVNGRGELLDEFKALGPTRVWRSPSFMLGPLPREWQAKLRPKLEARMLQGMLRGRNYDLVHVNTVANWQHVPSLARRAKSLLWHVHELDYALRVSTGNNGWQQTFPLATRFVAVSKSVKDALTSRFNVPAEKVDLIHGFVPAAELSAEEYRAKRQRIRTELGIPENAFLVGGCGTLGWRKGTDIFLQLANSIRRQGHSNVRFLWVGGGTGGEDALQFGHDLRAMDLRNTCHWASETSNVSDYYCAMDVFALTSREDPFPLVMLEAGAMGLPVVCFDGSGGGPEFVGHDAGLIAPYLDVEAFVGHLTAFLKNDNLRRQLGAEAARRVRTNHTVGMQAPKLLRSMQECLRAV